MTAYDRAMGNAARTVVLVVVWVLSLASAASTTTSQPQQHPAYQPSNPPPAQQQPVVTPEPTGPIDPNGPAPSAPAAGEPTLDETFAWLTSTLVAHGSFTINGEEKDDYGTSNEREVRQIKASVQYPEHCELHFRLLTSYSVWNEGEQPDAPSVGDLDNFIAFASVTDVTVAQSNQWGEDAEPQPWEVTIGGEGSVAEIVDDSQDIANRIANAIRHGASLCGAKKQPF
jgi:hypothetical protein